MSHQCSCGRDLNNNYVSYTNAYANSNSSLDANASLSSSGGKSSASSTTTSSMRSAAGGGPQTQLTAKVMFGTVGAIKELREKEKSRHAATRAGERRN